MAYNSDRDLGLLIILKKKNMITITIESAVNSGEIICRQTERV